MFDRWSRLVTLAKAVTVADKLKGKDSPEINFFEAMKEFEKMNAIYKDGKKTDDDTRAT